ncbi:hypothetical protein [Palleronia aestuarii]|uniref:hypothetical protein n=1 Tax=Palleronia aestuarii TaxID=568105 RepID=UPI001472893C|nr:hypothetical protein [Palleronia aestuarii]
MLYFRLLALAVAALYALISHALEAQPSDRMPGASRPSIAENAVESCELEAGVCDGR